jgi:transposase
MMLLPKGYVIVREEDLLLMQQQIISLVERIKELENRLNKDSSNSHKPPSSDSFRKPIQNNREKSNKNQGAQPGHKGTTLTMAEHPDKIIFHPVGGKCDCGRELKMQPTINVQRSQVIDIPEKLKEITEHQIEVKQCKCGQIYYGKTLSMAPIQYGSRIKAMSVYMNNYGFLPFDRLQDFFFDCFDMEISDGVLVSANEKCYVNLESTEQQIKDHLKSSPVIHNDETGLRCEKSLKWAHVSSNEDFTHYGFHDKRGAEAINDIGILPDYRGVSVHDRYSSYDSYQCDHGLCNAHLLRDLKGLVEDDKTWASQMIKLLLKAKKYKETIRLSKKIRDEIFSEYDKIVTTGLKSEPVLEENIVKKRGRKKKPDSLRLLETFFNRKDQILKFFVKQYVPFDNNLAERDLRMIKLKQKISGCFRTKTGAEIFCRIRSYISTIRKQGYNIIDSIQLAIDGNPINFQLTTSEQ